MLDRKLIRKDPERVRNGMERKGVEFDLDAFLALDERLRELIRETEDLKAERNRVSEEISRIKNEGGDAGDIISRMKETSARIKQLDAEMREASDDLDERQLAIPNLPHGTAPAGTCAEDNPVVREWGELPEQPEAPLPHWEIAERLGIIDFQAGAALGGSGFIVFRGDGALLVRALINLMLDIHAGQGYEEVWVPFVVNRDCMIGTGQLPKMEEDMYHVEKDDLFLVPTAEVPVTNLYRNRIVEGDRLPIGMTAYTPCFRREAGSYGKDTRGLIRVHEFDKVEMVKIVSPETSYDELETLVTDATAVLEALEIPYRVIELCAGDLSFSAAKCYDLETFATGVGAWLEVSSCSNFEDFQARRANIRFRPERGAKPEHPHTLNGSGLALPRVIATILENNQTPTGKVRIPAALVPYMRGREFLEA